VPIDAAHEVSVRPGGRVRWFICGLLFFATTVNYIDRQVIGILKPTLERELHWTESDFGWIVFAFQCAYAVMMPIAGRMIDWLGTLVGYALAVVIWSLASMSHAIARTSLQFAAARFGLGIGGLGGAMGGMLVAPAVGYWLDFSHGSYRPLFVCAGMAYLIALGIIHLMLPRLERTDL
jgi:MFS family permease